MYEHEHAMQRPVFLAKQAWPDRVKEAACLIVGFSFSFLSEENNMYSKN